MKTQASGCHAVRTPVPAVEVRASSFLPPVDALRAAVAGVVVGAQRAVWVVSSDGQLLHPMGQAVATAQEVAEQVTLAAVWIEQGRGVDLVVLHVGAGARDEDLHVRALVEALDRAAHQPTLPGRGPSKAVSR
ncbi:MAG TPA: hypothetical protein VFM55_19055 [Micromonosporaceae bacterium]|nr:hypothetical protein [Micromonosporaceae bacterium]